MPDESSPRGLIAAADAVDELEQRRLHRSLRARLFGDRGPPLVAGRYELGSRIGAGGMGVVYRARDRALDREVAIKLVRQDGGTSETTRAAQRRFLAEARSLARLAHPNVVAIFDVGTTAASDDGMPQVWIAMELCPGQDLQRWLAAVRPSWRAGLDVLLAAGRGLVAAHEVGVIHRDVKPPNVLVGDDPRGTRAYGRVRLLDFGVSTLADGGRSHGSSEGGDRDDAAPVTDRVHDVAGTPAYMAPEQHRGGAVDERSDQYAFCVMAFEVLYGVRPFAGTTSAALLEQKLAGAIAAPPRGTRIPAAIRHALERGLQPEPADRWPRLGDLLAALERGAQGRRRVVIRLGMVAGAVALALAWPGATPQRCADADEHLAGIWDDDRRAAARDAVLATALPYAEDTWARVEPRLSGYADDWSASFVATCTATPVESTVLDARMACLERARDGLAATVNVLAKADAATVQRAIDLVGALLPLERCHDVDASSADGWVPDDPLAAAEVDRIRAAVAHAMALRKAGRIADAASVLLPELARARALPFAPIQAEVLLELGMDHARTDDLALAEAELREAKTLAIDGGSPDVAARAAAELVFLVGYRRERPEEALALRDEVLALGRGRPAARLLAASAHTNLGSALQAAGRPADAEPEHRRAIELYAEVLGRDTTEVAMATNNLANALQGQGEYVDAETEHRRALAIREAVLGPHHPEVAMSRNNLANALVGQGRLAEAEGELREALAIRRASFGPQSADVATTRGNLGNVLGSLGRREEEQAEHRAALEIFARTLGPDHPRTATARYGVAYALWSAGALAEAEHELQDLIARHEPVLGVDHSVVSAARGLLARVALGRGDLEAAEAGFRAELERREDRLGPTHPGLLQDVLGLARVAAARGDEATARPLFERALAFTKDKPMSPVVRGEVRFAAAQSLPASERRRAVQLAEQARADYIAAGDAASTELRDVERWLEQRSRSMAQ